MFSNRKCHYCGVSYARNEAKCPRCYSRPRQSRSARVTLVVLAAGGLSLFGWWAIQNDSGRAVEDKLATEKRSDEVVSAESDEPASDRIEMGAEEPEWDPEPGVIPAIGERKRIDEFGVSLCAPSEEWIWSEVVPPLQEGTATYLCTDQSSNRSFVIFAIKTLSEEELRLSAILKAIGSSDEEVPTRTFSEKGVVVFQGPPDLEIDIDPKLNSVMIRSQGIHGENKDWVAEGLSFGSPGAGYLTMMFRSKDGDYEGRDMFRGSMATIRRDDSDSDTSSDE